MATDTTDGVRNTIGSVLQSLWTLIVRVLTLVATLVWVGFWLAITRLHYLQGDWVGVVLTGTLGIAPVGVLFSRHVTSLGIKRRLVETANTVNTVGMTNSPHE